METSKHHLHPIIASAAAHLDRGIELHLAQRYGEAASYFQRSLQQSQLNLKEVHEEISNSNVLSFDASYPTFRLQYKPLKSGEGIGSLQSRDQFFCGALTVAPTQGQNSTGQQQLFASLTTIAFAATFNLGVVSHIQGVLSKDTGKLRHAIQYYTCAYPLQDSQLHTSSSIAADNFVPTMALLNNMGVLFRQENDLQKSREVFRHLFTILAWHRESYKVARHHVTCDERTLSIIHGCWQNVSRYVLEDPHTATAA